MHRPKTDFQAQTTNIERATENRERVKKLKSPDVSKMTSLTVPGLRAIFYVATKKALKRKIKQLKEAGLSYTVK